MYQNSILLHVFQRLGTAFQRIAFWCGLLEEVQMLPHTYL